MLSKQQNVLEMLGLFIVSLLLFTWGLWSQEIVGFESRFYLFAQEMLSAGPGWFSTTYHQPYPDYPASSTVLIYLMAKLFGGLDKLIAVLPSAMVAAATVVLTYAIGSLRSKRWGLCAVCFLALTLSFLQEARSIALDMYPTLITAGCFYLLYTADLENKSNRVWWVFPLLLLGFVFRGPIGLVIPAGVMCVYYLIEQKFKKLFLLGFLALILLVVSTLLLLLIAKHVGGEQFMHDVLRMQIMGRIDSSYLPAHFYFTNGMGAYAVSFPLALFVILGLGYYFFICRITVPEAGFLLKLFGWMMVIVIGMSVPGDKKIRYILPMIPAAALLTAYPFAVVPQQTYFIMMRTILSRILLIMPLISLLLTAATYYYATSHVMNFGICYLCIGLFLVVMQVISFWLFYRRTNRRDISVLVIAAISFVITYVTVIEHAEVYMDRAHEFVAAVESQRTADHANLVFYKEKPDGLPIKYLINMPRREQPVFIMTRQQLENYTERAFFVTSVEWFEALPGRMIMKFNIVANDKLGHTRVVVFKRKIHE